MEVITSVFERRRRIYGAVKSGQIDKDLVETLLQGDRATSEEAALWDYKLELPLRPLATNNTATSAHDAKMAELVKDVVAFYNSFGGYILAGVHDETRALSGFKGDFDAADLNKRVQGATGVSVETIFQSIDLAGVAVGVLFIPQRPEKTNPVQFKKNAPENGAGKRAYAANDFYMRERDNCRPARTPEDFEFLYGRRRVEEFTTEFQYLDNNMPSRDQDLIRLIGREKEISDLWMWLSDVFNPVKILSGLGGVGKTSIAYTFAERLIYHGPPSLDRLIWLGAKAETFSGELNRYVPLPRVDFRRINELLQQILLETGCPPDQIPEDPSREELLHLCQSHLSAFSYFLIIDNVDTLSDEEQQLVFHVFTQLCSLSKTKCIITARRNLGAPRSVYVEIEGLKFDDFSKFVVEKAELLKIQAPAPKSVEMSRFHTDSGGSPLFALSVLRLVALGDSLPNALKNWRGSDGEAVREAAFQREISRLSGNEARVLLALCYLQSASVVELASVLGLTRFEIQEALVALQAFSMTSVDATLAGGSNFIIPRTIALVTSLVEQRVANATAIETACREFRAVASNKSPFISQAVARAMAFMAQKNAKAARDIAVEALKKLPDDPDLTCLFGRCEFAVGDVGAAKNAYQKAHELGCRKRELFAGWSEVAESQQDWRKLIEVTSIAEEATSSCRYRIKRNVARAHLSDERCRSGDYPGAVAILEEALTDVREGFKRYPQGGDRAELWNQTHELVLRWLGAVRVQSTSMLDGGRRMFGAYCKAYTIYQFQKDQILASAIESLSDWLGRVRQRKALSDTAREQVDQARGRLANLVRAVDQKHNEVDTVRAKFLSAAAGLDQQMELLLK